MGRVAEERDGARAPTVKSGKAVERPAAPGFRPLEQGFRVLGPTREAREHVRGAAGLVPALTARAARYDGDNVEICATADRIVHEMRAWPDPEPDHGFGEAGGESRARDLRAPRRRAGKAQARPGTDESAQRRPNSIGADQARAIGLAAISGARGDAVASLRVDRRKLEAGSQGGAGLARERRAQASVKIGAAQCQIGCAVALFGRAAERHRGKLAARDAVMDDDCVGPEGVALDRIERAERSKRAGGVGTELNSGARLLGELGAFEDFAVDPLPRERDGRSQPANAAAGNECLPWHG